MKTVTSHQSFCELFIKEIFCPALLAKVKLIKTINAVVKRPRRMKKKRTANDFILKPYFTLRSPGELAS